MLKTDMWKIFLYTGSLEAYLYYKQHKDMSNDIEEDVVNYPVAANERGN